MAVRTNTLKKSPIPYALAVVIGFAFGAADQYLGSLSQVGAAVSNLSAPWLLLAFALGGAQDCNGRAALRGLVGLEAAVAGYTAMIMSPVEGVHNLALWQVLTVARSQAIWFAGALLFGPLYGRLGQMWRRSRSVLSAVLAASPVLLEPLAAAMRLKGSVVVVNYGEVIAGVAVAVYFTAVILRTRAVVRSF